MSAPAATPTVTLPAKLLNGDARFEVVNGQVVELPPMGAYENVLACFLARLMGNFADEHQLGIVVVEVLFDLSLPSGQQRRPDVAFVSYQRWPRHKRVPSGLAWTIVPELAVEIISETNLASEVQTKLDDYFEAGVQIAWVIYPEQRRAYVYTSSTDVRIVDRAGELDGATALPGFRLPLATLFEEETNVAK